MFLLNRGSISSTENFQNIYESMKCLKWTNQNNQDDISYSISK